MIRIENPLGTIEISQEYFSYLVGNAATSCYGVVGMVKSGTRQGLRSVFYRRSFADDGIRVHSENDKLVVDLHIAVIYGMNISAIAKSIVASHHGRISVTSDSVHGTTFTAEFPLERSS